MKQLTKNHIVPIEL